jgi:hypothetical protein
MPDYRPPGYRSGDQLAKRWPGAAAVLTIALAAACVAWAIAGIVVEWDEARAPALMTVCGVALAIGVQLLYVLGMSGGRGSELLQVAATMAALPAAAVVFGAAPWVDRFRVDAAVFVLGCAWAATALALLIPLAVWGLRLRREHGDAASDVARATIRRRLGRSEPDR